MNKKMVMVQEVYMMEGETVKGWIKVNKEMEVSEIFRMFKAGEISMVNVITEENKWWGLDLNEYNFTRKFEREIIENLIVTAEEQKEEAFKNFRNRRNALTSYSGIDSTVIQFFKDGMYFIIDGSCHTSIKFFMNWAGEVIRKPRKIELIKESWIGGINC